MTNHGDDCYFYYYSTCTKGDSCPFRHCEAARGNETICNLWQEGRCFRTVCKFRHMEITKKRKEIPCYWENQPAGCQKPHCAFFHEKPRYIEGIFVPADKSHTEEPQHEEPAPPPTPLLPNAANPQLRSVIKTETQEPVPSPTHPPVVINAADDDEDEDDQFSEEGEEGKTGPSPKKFKSGDSLNFGVSTLEEIRLRKALKASMKRAGYPVQNAETPNNREKENIQSFYRPTPPDPTGSLVLEEAERPRSSMAERLGRKIPRADLKTVECVPLKRSLAERLGRVVDEEQPSVPPQKVLRSVKERLGLLTGPGEDALTAETNVVSTKAPEQIRIKTLEEIQQEKATKSLSQNNVPLLVASDVTTTSQTKTTRVIKRALAMKGEETFSEVFQAKKQKLKEEQVQNSRLKKSKQLSENDPEKSQVEPDSFQSHPKPTDVEKVQVKTLDEIRKEKAARLRAEQGEQTDTKKITDTEWNVTKRCRLLRIKKSQTQDNVTPEKAAEETEKPPVAPAPAPETSNNIKVKTFEEIMREKRLRKQEIEEQVKSPAETPSSQNQTATGFLNRTGSTKTSLKSSQSLLPSSSTPPKVPIRKLMKPEASSVLIRTASDTVKASVPVKQSSPLEPKTQSISTEVTDKNASVLCLQSSDKLIKEPHWAEAAEVLGVPHADESLDNNQSKSPERPDSKVKPKLNVKPSVVKPAVQMKKRGAERSAVAAVKPLSSTTAVQEEPTCRDKKVFPFSNVEAQLISAHPLSPAILLDSGLSSTPLREELQTVPVFTPSQSQEAKPAAIREFCAVPQSPVLKTPTQFKSRRSSAAASRAASTSSTDANTSAMDDFEELINQFTDDHLEEDVDPAIREDDLLQELSEMIDS